MAHVIKGMTLQDKKAWTYPWDEWLDGQVRVLVPDQDYPAGKEQSFRGGAYAQARSRGMKATTSLLPPKTVIDGILLKDGGILLSASDEK